jgi:hypothetical protein
MLAANSCSTNIESQHCKDYVQAGFCLYTVCIVTNGDGTATATVTSMTADPCTPSKLVATQYPSGVSTTGENTKTLGPVTIEEGTNMVGISISTPDGTGGVTFKF